MGDTVGYLVAVLVGVFGTAGAVVVLLLLIPEKVEQWVALLWRLADRVGLLARRAHKQYVKHDLQGNVNSFLARKMRDVPGLGAKGVRLKFVDDSVTRDSFLKDDHVVIRLRREDDTSTNFVRATCTFVSTSLLHKAKRYLSQSQAEATHLFVSMEILKEEKPDLVDVFFDEYLHRRVGSGHEKVSSYFDRYALIDEGGLFFPVYLQELHYLGEKVFGGPRQDRIMVEVDDLVGHLEQLAQRQVGDESVPLEFMKDYCKFGIVIVGKRVVMEQRGIDVYINFIRRKVIPSGVETLYLIGPSENAAAMATITNEVDDSFDVVVARMIERTLRTAAGAVKSRAHLVVLRGRSRTLFAPSKKIGAWSV